MSLVVFRSKAAGEIYYLPENAHRIFDILGKQAAPRGVITAEQVPDAIARLMAAVEEEKARLKEAAPPEEGERADEARRAVTLEQRVFPLLDMLRAAQKKNVDVTWGV